MILIWTSTRPSVFSFALSTLPKEKEILLIHDVASASIPSVESEKVSEALQYAPDDLLPIVLPAIPESPMAGAVRRLTQSGFTVHETHRDILSFFLEEHLDPFFEGNKDAWLSGFDRSMSRCLSKLSVEVNALPGRTLDPIAIFIPAFITSYGVENARLSFIFEQRVGGVDRLICRSVPCLASAVNLIDPTAMMLLLYQYAVHEDVSPLELHRAVNVSEVASRIISSRLTKLTPAERGERRAYHGLYKALRKVSHAMLNAGLVERIGTTRRDDYRLTTNGHLFAKLGLRYASAFDQTAIKPVLESFALIKDLAAS